MRMNTHSGAGIKRSLKVIQGLLFCASSPACRPARRIHTRTRQIQFEVKARPAPLSSPEGARPPYPPTRTSPHPLSNSSWAQGVEPPPFPDQGCSTTTHPADRSRPRPIEDCSSAQTNSKQTRQTSQSFSSRKAHHRRLSPAKRLKWRLDHREQRDRQKMIQVR